MSKCSKHHLFFIPLSNGHFNAVDTWCGHEVNGKIWYCSEECMKEGNKATPRGYIPPTEEIIMND